MEKKPSKIKAVKKRGRPSLSDKPMTSTERARRFRENNPNYNKRPKDG